MGGFIVLDDGRAYARSNWAFDAVVEAATRSLPATPAGKSLAARLLDQRSVRLGPGRGSVDVREMAPADREMFLAAIEQAYTTESARERPPEGWNPSTWTVWLAGFADLVRMIGCVRRGEPPGDFNPHMKNTVSPTASARDRGTARE